MDLSKLPDSQRQELEQLQKQFQEHRQKQQESAAAVQQQPPPYDPFHAHQTYDPSHAYDQSYYYNYHHPSHHQHQSHQQYDASYYQNYYSNSYQPHHHASAYTASIEQQRNEESGSGSGSLGLGRFQDPYVNPGGPPGLNPTAAAAAVAALSQLTQFAGAMGGPMAGGGHFDQGHFRPPVGHTPYRGGGRRGGGPIRGGGRGSSGFRPSGPPFRGRGRDRNRGRGRGGRHGPPPSHSESSANASAQPPVQTARCEVCKVDCTTDEVLGQHNNGKRHKRNLQKLQDKKGAYQPVVQTENAKPSSDIDPGVDKNIPESEPDKQTEQKEQAEQPEVGDANNKVETVEKGNQEKKHRMKRKMKGRVRGNRGGAKRMKATGPRHRKVVMPLVCDLCNIKCDTQEVFDRHSAGKKHIAKLKRFEGHQAMYGPTAVQALYPPNPLSQTLGPQPAYYGPPSSYPPPPEAYIPPPHPAQNPNPQLADAPLEFGTHNAVLTG